MKKTGLVTLVLATKTLMVPESKEIMSTAENILPSVPVQTV